MKKVFSNTAGMLMAIVLAGVGYAADINTLPDTQDSVVVIDSPADADVITSDNTQNQALNRVPVVKTAVDNQVNPDISAEENMQQLAVPQVDSGIVPATVEEDHKAPDTVVTTTETTKELIERLTALEKQVQIQIIKLSTRLSLLDKELLTYKQQSSGGFYGKIWQQLAIIEEHMGSRLFMVVIFGVIVIAFLLFGYIIMPRRKVAGAASCYGDNLSTKESAESEDVYNNDMYNHDNYAAKLNLARAYTEMGEKDKAEKILNDIVTQGNAEERKEAQDLLDKISAHNA